MAVCWGWSVGGRNWPAVSCINALETSPWRVGTSVLLLPMFVCSVFALKCVDPSTLCYHTLHAPPGHAHTPSQLLRDYFQLDTNLTHLCELWAQSDSNFNHKMSCYKGIRLLRQDPLENVISFICSSNNNIARISGMLNSLCQLLGDPICCYGDHQVYRFPTLDELCAKNMEQTLRDLGFGYRSKYVAMAAKSIAEKGGVEWLMELRENPYNGELSHALQCHNVSVYVCVCICVEVVTSLQTLPGVGPKVADCIAMMSCDKFEAVPIDTHVWKIATRDYGLVQNSKSLTTSAYREIGRWSHDSHVIIMWWYIADRWSLSEPVWVKGRLGHGCELKYWIWDVISSWWLVQILFVADLERNQGSKVDKKPKGQSSKGRGGKRKRNSQQRSKKKRKTWQLSYCLWIYVYCSIPECQSVSNSVFK